MLHDSESLDQLTILGARCQFLLFRVSANYFDLGSSLLNRLRIAGIDQVNPVFQHPFPFLLLTRQQLQLTFP
ncbi:hypothetical protein D3C73_1467550 [compost metagenome]